MRQASGRRPPSDDEEEQEDGSVDAPSQSTPAGIAEAIALDAPDAFAVSQPVVPQDDDVAVAGGGVAALRAKMGSNLKLALPGSAPPPRAPKECSDSGAPTAPPPSGPPKDDTLLNAQLSKRSVGTKRRPKTNASQRRAAPQADTSNDSEVSKASPSIAAGDRQFNSEADTSPAAPAKALAAELPAAGQPKRSSNSLFDDDDDGGLFGAASKPTSVPSASLQPAQPAASTSKGGGDLFGDADNDARAGLFGGLKPSAPRATKPSLFGDSDDEEPLFGAKASAQPAGQKKASLFDDD